MTAFDKHLIERTWNSLQNALDLRSEVHNFCAGPGMNDTSVLLELMSSLVNFENRGIGIQEMSHRDPGGPVQTCLFDTCQLFREVLSIPSNYEVLLMPGGAHAQFAALPLNLLTEQQQADYINGGFWSQKAYYEAQRVRQVRLVPALNSNGDYLSYRPVEEWDLNPDASYVHICANETINGLEFLDELALPNLQQRPVVADFTSTLLSRPVDISQYGVIYASGGKNLGPAGTCIVIIRKDLIRERPACPSILSYAQFANSKPIPNIANTPNMIAIRAFQLNLEQIKKNGGIEHYHRRTKSLSEKLYSVIDGSEGFYSCRAEPKYRSTVTIPFNIRGGNRLLEERFVNEATLNNLQQTFGHHSVGGLRICLYNPISEKSVQTLIDFMEDFYRLYKKRPTQRPATLLIEKTEQ